MNYKQLTKIRFPNPRNININMMPIIMGNANSIPLEFRHYNSLICESLGHLNNKNEHLNQIGFLSVQESIVEHNKSQRRPGIHIEATEFGWGNGWGKGNNLNDGIFMCSTTSSCRIWNPVHVMEPNYLYWLTDQTLHESIVNEGPTFYRQWFRLVTKKVDGWFSRHSTNNPKVQLPKKLIITSSKF